MNQPWRLMMKTYQAAISNVIISLSIIFFFIFINFTYTPTHEQNNEDNSYLLPINRIDEKNEESPKVMSTPDNELSVPTRARYLDHIIDLDDPEVQLMVISGDASDNGYSNSHIRSGTPIATGDIDNDGMEDLILGCPYADGLPENRWNGGQVMIIFGGTQQHPSTIYDQAEKKPDELDIILHGADNGDLLGGSIACGDIDGDGYDDIVMGAPLGDSKDNNREDAGEVYIMFGDERSAFEAELDFRSTPPDVMIYGVSGGDRTGYSLALGNVISDNKMDIIIGAVHADPSNKTNAGAVYILAGNTRNNLGKEIDLRSPSRGVRIEGETADDRAGFSVASGDVNGDGRDDILIGARLAEYDTTRNNSGITYVIYGRRSLPADLNLSIETNAYIYGADTDDNSGWSLATGDINGDSYEDILVGAVNADGPNNGNRDCGEVYIIYGSTSISKYIDLDQNEYDIVINGVDAWDNFGFSVATGFLNDDRYCDFLIGARGGNGEYNDKGDCGDSYLILGNNSSNFGDNIDPITGAKAIIYGIDAGDNSGRFVHFGDLDGDCLEDIIIGAPYADGPINSRDSSGEFYVIYSAPPPLQNEFLSLVDGDLDNKTIFARYRPYIFRVNVSNILGYHDIHSVTLSLDPEGHNITFQWSRLENKFLTITNPLGLIDCTSTASDARHDGAFNYSIEFKLIFNWNFTPDSALDCLVNTRGILSYQDTDRYEDIFGINNTLNLLGTLQISGAIQGNLKNNDWVKGSEKITFSGLTMVYNGTTDYYPPVNEYTLAIVDNTNTWPIINIGLGQKISKTITAPDTSTTFYYSFKLLNLPTYCQIFNINVSLRIDNEAPPVPESVICKADSFSDLSEALVDNDLEIYVLWSKVVDTGAGTKGYHYGFNDFSSGSSNNAFWTEDVKARISNSSEGLNNLYVWAEDNVGNIGLSSSTAIFIDLTEVTFENFQPTTTGWLTTTSINCSIQVNDENGYGVDPESIEYLDMESKKWLPGQVEQIENQSYINVSVTANLLEGTGSFVQFRAIDLAGNGPTESEKFYLNIDTLPVTFSSIRPNETEKQSETRVRCYMTVQDTDGSGVDLSTIQYSSTTTGLENFTGWTNKDLARVVSNSAAADTTKWFVDLVFARGGENYVHWCAKDLAGNGPTESDAFPVFVNALPVIIIEGFDPDDIYDTLTEIEFNAENTSDPDDVLLDKNFIWSSSISGSIGSGRVIRTKLPSGEHVIELDVFDGLEHASYKFDITVISPEEEKTDSKGIFGISEDADGLIIALVVIIIIILVLFLFVYIREKKIRKKLEEKVLSTGTVYMSRYRPMMSGGKEVQELPGGVLGQEPAVFSLSTSPYVMKTAGPMDKVQQLPGVGGTGAAQGTPTPTVAGAPGTVGRKLPQLPPAQVSGVTGIQKMPELKAEIDTNKKLELLEKKMLLGEIPVELYNKLSKKYEQELRDKANKPELANKQPTEGTVNKPPPVVAGLTPDAQQHKEEKSETENEIKKGFENAPGFSPDELEFLRKLRKEKNK